MLPLIKDSGEWGIATPRFIQVTDMVLAFRFKREPPTPNDSSGRREAMNGAALFRQHGIDNLISFVQFARQNFREFLIAQADLDIHRTDEIFAADPDQPLDSFAGGILISTAPSGQAGTGLLGGDEAVDSPREDGSINSLAGKKRSRIRNTQAVVHHLCFEFQIRGHAFQQFRIEIRGLDDHRVGHDALTGGLVLGRIWMILPLKTRFG